MKNLYTLAIITPTTTTVELHTHTTLSARMAALDLIHPGYQEYIDWPSVSSNPPPLYLSDEDDQTLYVVTAHANPTPRTQS